MDIYKKLREQMNLSHSGKLNLLRHDNGQFVGCFYLSQGSIVGGKFRNLNGKDSVILMSYMSLPDVEDGFNDIDVVVEPEIVNKLNTCIDYDFNRLKTKVLNYYKEWQEIKKFCPPKDIFLVPILEITPKTPTPTEFQLLRVMSSYNSVEEILAESPFLPTETVKILVSLRKQGMIKVVKSV